MIMLLYSSAMIDTTEGLLATDNGRRFSREQVTLMTMWRRRFDCLQVLQRRQQRRAAGAMDEDDNLRDFAILAAA